MPCSRPRTALCSQSILPHFPSSIQDVTAGRHPIYSAQEGANQGLWGDGQCSQAVAQRSCLLAGPEAHQTRKEGGPGDAPYLHLQSLVLRSPILRTPQRGSKLSLPWNVLLPDHTDSTWPLHYCSFLSPICFPTWTTPYLASCSSSIYSAKHS